MNPENLAVVITGASRGLGRALAGGFAERGARVVLVARNQRALDQSVHEIHQNGGTAFGIALDVAEKDAAYRIAGQAAALVGPIDVLINNASTLGPVPLRLLLDTECEDLERSLAVNLIGPFRLTKAVLGSMVLRERGLVVNVSSDAAVEPYERWGAYASSKAALDQLTRVWAAELAQTSVRVVSVDPGEMDTEMHAAAMPSADRSLLASPRETAQRLLAILLDERAAPNGSRLIVAGPRPEAAA